MQDEKKKSKSTVRVVYAHYDYSTRVNELRYGDAIIGKNGAAMIQKGMFGVLERKPGEYLIADSFLHEWKLCIKKRAEEMAKDLVKQKDGKEGGDNANS